jgi:hypothetical protein
LTYWRAAGIGGRSTFRLDTARNALVFSNAVVPAWDTTFSNGNIEGQGASISFLKTSDIVTLNSNLYYGTANWRYKKTAAASQMYLFNGELVFRNAVSGTAAAAITFANAFVVKGDGKVGINTNNPQYNLHVIKNAAAAVEYIGITNSSTSGASGYIALNDAGDYAGMAVFGTNYTIASLRGKASFSSKKDLIFVADGDVLSGGTSYALEFRPGGATEAANALYLKNGAAAVGLGVTSINASSVLDLVSTTRGFLPPRMTTAQRNAIASPAAGLSVYNSSLATNDVYTSAWYQQPNGLTGSGTLDFPNTLAQTSSDMTITVTGAAVGDIVILGTPVQGANSTFTAFVSATNTVSVRMNNYSALAIDPASAAFKVYVIKN